MRNAAHKIYLHPGEFHFAGDGVHIHTLLGSCISITLWHPKRRIGGMCHFTLPKHPGYKKGNGGLDGRYADDVIEMFRKEVARYSTRITDYEAKIFGGGNMIRSADQNIDDSIGTKNSAAAMQLLMQENVNIMVAHVGEFGHRRIVFDSGTGEVWVRHIEPGKGRISSINGVI